MIGDRQESRSGWIAIVCIALLALALRLAFLVGGGGPLASPTDYDDGVYFSASALLLRGVLPYRDFVFVHPPGVLYFFGLVSWLKDPASGFAAARILAALVGAINAYLAGRIVQRSYGVVGGFVAALLYAIYPDAVTAERSPFIEPVLNLGCLTSAFLWLEPRDEKRRPFLAGFLGGAACAAKLLGGIWMLAAVASAARGRFGRDVSRFVAGGIVAGVLLLGPLFIAAPSQMVDGLLRFQFARPPDGTVEMSARVPLILDSGHRAATLFAVLGLFALVIAILRRTPARELRFFSLATLLTIAAFLASSSYWTQYNAYLAASQCVLGGLGIAVLMRRIRNAVALVAIVAIVGFLQWSSLQNLVQRSRERVSAMLELRDAARFLPRDVKVFAFDPAWGLAAGKLPPHADGAPVIVDSYGAMLMTAMKSGTFADAGIAFAAAPAQPDARKRLEASQYAILGWRGNWQLSAADRAWAASHFVCVTQSSGDLCIARRITTPITRLAESSGAVAFGSGWYSEEGTAPTSWRWMAGQADVTLPPLASAATLQVQFEIPQDVLAHPPTITIELDGRLLDRFIATGGETTRIYSVVQGTALRITTSETFRPSDRGGNDTRELGLNLKRLVWLTTNDWQSR